jgi:hypothetical protein
MLRAKPEGPPASARYPAARVHGRRARDNAHARDDAGARRTQRRDGRGCVARAGEQRSAGPADRQTKATHLMHKL